jgi:hypothetical protein
MLDCPRGAKNRARDARGAMRTPGGSVAAVVAGVAALSFLLAGGACAGGTGASSNPATAAAGSSRPPTPPASAAPTPRPAVPASRVPDQPYVGTPRPVEQPYLEILGLKDRGATNEELLAKVRRESVVYSLSTYDIQKLRASGVSEEVIAAMLGAGRPAPTATPAMP